MSIRGYSLLSSFFSMTARRVVEEVPLRVEPNEHNRGYLSVKKSKMGHKL